METKKCQNCKKDFVIEEGDFDFYAKLKVPAPTFCPECRLMRRLAWRNERNLYRRKCDVPGHGESIISMYPESSPFPVYDSKYWWGDTWDACDYAKEFDSTRPFFEQWKELFNSVPTLALINLQGVASDYCNFTYQSKNCYLNFASDMNEDTAYLYHSIENRFCYDMLGSRKNENCYELIDSEECYNSEYLTLSSNCIDSKYCYDCVGCSNVVGCVGLRNEDHCILNIKYSPEDYVKKLDDFGIHTSSGLNDLKNQFEELLLKQPRRFSNSRHTVNSTGDYLNGVKNCKDCFDAEGPMEDSRFVVYGVTAIRDVYDGYAIGVNIEKSCDVMDCGSNVSDTAFSGNVWEGYGNRYCYFTKNCSNCFGCVGTKNKQYCILNKQYSKEEYEKLVPQIIEQMNAVPYVNKDGVTYRYGEFFPIEMSPFAYNESIAQEWFPDTEESVKKRGYRWVEKKDRDYKIDVEPGDLPRRAQNADDSLVGKVLGCAHKGTCAENCTTGFKLTAEELAFYKRRDLPLPKFCPNCRHYQRLKQRNPMRLWHRSCMCAQEGHDHNGKCPNEFETSYASERPELVYCEACYQKQAS